MSAMNAIPKVPIPLPQQTGAQKLPVPPGLSALPVPPKAPSVAVPTPKAASVPTPIAAPTPQKNNTPVIPGALKPNNTANGPTLPGGVPIAVAVSDKSEEEKAMAKMEALKSVKNDVANIQEAQRENVQEVEEAESKEIDAPKEAGNEETPKETKRGRKSTKKSTSKEATSKESDNNDSEEAIEEGFVTIKLKPTCKDYEIIESKIFGTFNDPKWEQLKEEVTELNAKIIIESDMSVGVLKQAIADLNKLRSKILVLYVKYQTNFQNLVSDKPEGIIERVKRLGSKGTNDNERRRNGILACMQYEMGGEIIDLFELLEQTRERYNFFKGIMEAIEQKQKALITMNSAILMEQKLDQ